MFKKKTSLPARPPIPNKDEILEDLTGATSDDIVFKPNEENAALVTDEAVSISSTSEKKENSDSIDKTDRFYQYRMITKYVEKFENLHKYNEEIRNGRDGLQYLQNGLLEDMMKVREELEKQMGGTNPEEIMKNFHLNTVNKNFISF